MLAILPFDSYVANGVREVLRVRGLSYLSIISAKSDLIFCGGTPEFNRMLVLEGRNVQGEMAVNYRISAEVMGLLLRSELLTYSEGSNNVYLLLEEVCGREKGSKELLVCLKRLTNKEIAELRLCNKREPIQVSESKAYTETQERFIIPCSIDYDIETKLSWYAAWKSSRIQKFPMDMGGIIRQLVEISKTFKTGVCIENGLAYSDSSKNGIEVYRNVAYNGVPMLLSQNCIMELSSFIGNETNSINMFRYGEYMMSARGNLILVWRNLRFSFHPNIDDLSKQKPLAVFETSRKKLSDLMASISIGKSDNMTMNINFMSERIRLECPTKGKYSFSVPFRIINGDYTEESTSVSMNFRVFRDIMLMRVSYNRMRVFVYKHFFRIDFINLVSYADDPEEFDEDDIDPEDLGDSEYDGYNKMITVFGRSGE